MAVPGWNRRSDPAAVLLHLLEKPVSGEHRNGTGGRAADGTGRCAETGVPWVLCQKQSGGYSGGAHHGVEHTGTPEYEDGGRGGKRLYSGGRDPAVRGDFLPACRTGGADWCAGVRLCPAGYWPSERPHRSCEPPGSGGIVRRGRRIHPRPAGSEVLWAGRGFRSAIPGCLPGQ